eukprot:CAMPEP_0194480784 /NCGR_PEP_ID=MMETSP0253-20130528/3470_1 /TAXON_ID=2966 /ORGANISM="Noctiluca scintillans" /LENGTH=80 /DNA_ID=CAMNT_0039320213 /DNA_START=567 /DNA_END=809 /DNA_ORIENTATION=+
MQVLKEMVAVVAASAQGREHFLHDGSGEKPQGDIVRSSLALQILPHDDTVHDSERTWQQSVMRVSRVLLARSQEGCEMWE